jgi:hypothetical protein
MTGKNSIASPDGALSFIFFIFGSLSWYCATFTLDIGSLFTAGFIEIVLGLGTLSASLINVIKGKARANINLLATFLLGFFPGIDHVSMAICGYYGISFSFRIFGLMYILGAIFCFAVMLRRYDRPLYRQAGTLGISLGLFFIGLGECTNLKLLNQIGGWCMLLFAFEMFYFGLSILYEDYGLALRQGASLKERLEQKHER